MKIGCLLRKKRKERCRAYPWFTGSTNPRVGAWIGGSIIQRNWAPGASIRARISAGSLFWRGAQIGYDTGSMCVQIVVAITRSTAEIWRRGKEEMLMPLFGSYTTKNSPSAFGVRPYTVHQRIIQCRGWIRIDTRWLGSITYLNKK